MKKTVPQFSVTPTKSVSLKDFRSDEMAQGEPLTPETASDGSVVVGQRVRGKVHLEFFGSPRGHHRIILNTEHRVVLPPAVLQDGSMVFSAYDGVHFLDAKGKEKSFYKTEKPVSAAPRVAPDGSVIVAGQDMMIYFFIPNGRPKAMFQSDDYSSFFSKSPAVMTDGTAVAGAGSRVYFVEPTGRVKAVFRATDSGEKFLTSAPIVTKDGTIVVGTTNHTLYFLNPNGTQKAAFTEGSGFYGTPAELPDGTIVAGEDSGRLHFLSSDGKVKASFLVKENEELNRPLTMPDGTVVISAKNGNKLFFLNADGSLKSTYPLSEKMYSKAALQRDGTVVILSRDGQVHLLKVSKKPVGESTVSIDVPCTKLDSRSEGAGESSLEAGARSAY